jgi:proteasome accessory factor C
MERGHAPLSEMAERFQLTEAELLKDLELVAMCGLPPYLDECIDLFVDEGEASGPLARALVKLESVLGADGMVLDLDPPPATADLAAAIERNERVDITYWSASSDEVSERTIVPRIVFSDRGRWYVEADDDRSGEVRRFRIDRIRAWTLTGERGDADRTDRRSEEPPTGDRWFLDAPELPTVTLRLAPDGRWVAERFPVRAQHEDGDDLVVEMVVASERWLRQVLLQLGPNVVVVEPQRWTGLAARAARELLDARYAAAG